VYALVFIYTHIVAKTSNIFRCTRFREVWFRSGWTDLQVNVSY